MTSDRTISPDRVRQQFKLIFQDPSFKRASRLKAILKYLMEEEIKDVRDDVQLTSEVIARSAFKHTVTSSSVRAGAINLRNKLHAYNDNHDVDVLITLEHHHLYGYRARYRDKNSAPAVGAASAVPVPIKGRLRLVDCREVGNARQALQYVIEQLPLLSSLWDVHTRPEERVPEYDDDLLDEFQQSLAAFLKRSHHNRLSVIVGRAVERPYMEKVIAAAKEKAAQVEVHRLDQWGFLMNFALLEYAEHGRKAVMLGWGHYSVWSHESVFLSEDAKLFGEFENYYKKLLELSDKIAPVTEFFNTLENTKIEPYWEQEKVYELLDSALPGSEVRMLAPLFRDELTMYEKVQELLERGIHVKIVLMDHNNAQLLKARFKRRKKMPPASAQARIQEQVESFRELRAELAQKRSKNKALGTLEITQSDLMPFGVYLQSGAKILLGILPPLSSYNRSPMIEIDANSPLGLRLQENWREYCKPDA